MLMRILTNRWVHIVILLGLLAGAVYVRMKDHRWVESLSFIAFDSYNRWFPRTPADLVTMVDIDESSLARPELGQWPWSRDVMAKLVSNLHDMGARAIVFDMVFPEPDRTSPAAIVGRLPAEGRPETVTDYFAQLPDHDDVFARAIAEAGNVVMGFVCTSTTESTNSLPYQAKPVLLKNAERLRVIPQNPGDRDFVLYRPSNATNLPALSKAAAGSGSFCVDPEVDGLIRRVPMLVLTDNGRHDGAAQGLLYPSLAMEALRVAQNAKSVIKVRALSGEEAGGITPPLLFNVGKYEIPMDWDARFIVYFAEARPWQYIPAWRVLSNEVSKERIAGKVVFVGTSAAGLKDIRSTPLNLYIPGVELHMNVVEQVLTETYLRRPEVVRGAEILCMIPVACLIIMLSPFIGAIYMALFTFALVGGTAVLSWYSFAEYGLLIDPVYPSLCIVTIFVVSTLLTYIRTEYERARVRQAFGLYISPEFMEELTRDPDKLKLGGETRELTVMFTDIRGFTTISESMSPEALIQLMNSFLTPMSDLVMETRGTIDKYMGDAMMAFWNAPLDDADHARHASLAALRMYQALAPVNEELKIRAQAERRPPVVLNAGIGINTGPASVGNMGSRQRFAYSALGDTVNLASRLEGQTKQYGVNILISEATQRYIPDFAALELDLIRVKGKREPVRIFTLLGEESRAADPAFAAWKKDHDAMMKAYRARDFAGAILLAEKCRMEHGEEIEGFYAMFAARIGELRVRPPEEGWDGVYVATSK